MITVSLFSSVPTVLLTIPKYYLVSKLFRLLSEKDQRGQGLLSLRAVQFLITLQNVLSHGLIRCHFLISCKNRVILSCNSYHELKLLSNYRRALQVTSKAAGQSYVYSVKHRLQPLRLIR